jgi:hypothetical protein
MREIDMGNDRELFTEDRSGVPVYEGRMVAQFDHRAKGYRSGRGRTAEWADLPFSLPTKSIQPQWYIPADKIPDKPKVRICRYRIGFCDVASPTNERTLVAALIPPGPICGHKVPTIVFEAGFEWAYPYWLAVANSFAMDFIARKKVSLSMSYTVLDSLPFPRLNSDDPRVRLLVPLVLRLTCTSPEMTEFWNLLAKQGWVDPVAEGQLPGLREEEDRLLAKAEIDAIVARTIFDLSRTEMEYVLDTFPTYRGYQEDQYGEYRSRRLILEIYAALDEASQKGQVYESRLATPQAEGAVTHTLASLLTAACPSTPFPLKLPPIEIGPEHPSIWVCHPLGDGQPTPEEGAWVLVRHEELRRGASSPGIAAGQLALNPLAEGMEVLLKGMIPPARLRLTTEEWKTFRPLAVLKPDPQPE